MKQILTGKIVNASYNVLTDSWGTFRGETLEFEIRGLGFSIKYKNEGSFSNNIDFDDEITITISNEKVIEEASI